MAAPLAPADLDAYFARVGHDGRTRPDHATLAALHAGHVATIPFENLDVRWGRPLPLDPPALLAKLVHARRGGYCFEHNGLLAAVLASLGFRVLPLAARVRFGATRPLPRTHQLLLVEADGERHVVDAGFGAQTPLAPLPLAAGREHAQGAWRYRLDAEGDLWVLRTADADGWADLYAFTLEPAHPADLEMAHWYVATHPASRFVQTLTVQRATPQARHVVRNAEYVVDRGSAGTDRATLDHDDLLALITGPLGLHLPAGTRLPLPT